MNFVGVGATSLALLRAALVSSLAITPGLSPRRLPQALVFQLPEELFLILRYRSEDSELFHFRNRVMRFSPNPPAAPRGPPITQRLLCSAVRITSRCESSNELPVGDSEKGLFSSLGNGL